MTNGKSIRVARDLPGSGIRKIFNMASQKEKEGDRVFHLEIGRPYWQMPPGAASGVICALESGFVNYIHNRGLIELREAISNFIRGRTGYLYDPEAELIVTCGASEAIAMIMLAFVSSGDEVIVLEPAWPHYVACIKMAGGTPVRVPRAIDNGYGFQREAVSAAITDRTKLIVINNPCNPTGAVYSAEELRDLSEIARKYGLLVVSDEIYKDFVWGDQYTSMVEIMADRDSLILVDGFSKSYAMTGWRIGYVAASPEVSDALNRVHQYLTVCGVAFAQKGATKVLQNPKLPEYNEKMRAAFLERHNVWCEALVDCPGVEFYRPGGAFYFFPKIDLPDMDGHSFCMKMLNEYGLAMVPGDVFGVGYEQHVRIAYGGNLEIQREAAHIFSGALREMAENQYLTH
ncbi:pyridoxal phosphate-dependent aminotransferase [Candidatus Poribacteria bacterium]